MWSYTLSSLCPDDAICNGIPKRHISRRRPTDDNIWLYTLSSICPDDGSESVIWYEWVMSHMNESCHIWMRRITYEWVVSHMNVSCLIWMSRVTNESVIWYYTNIHVCLVWEFLHAPSSIVCMCVCVFVCVCVCACVCVCVCVFVRMTVWGSFD